MPVFFVCAGLIGLLTALLVVHVGRVRTRTKIFLGDGGNPELLSAVRAHANLIETAPLGLFLIYVASDFHGFWTIAVLSAALVVGRALHAAGMLGMVPGGRFIGTLLTMAVLVVASILLILVGINLRQY